MILSLHYFNDIGGVTLLGLGDHTVGSGLGGFCSRPEGPRAGMGFMGGGSQHTLRTGGTSTEIECGVF